MTSDQADAFIAALNRLADVAQSIFAIPLTDEVAAVFGLGFITPVTLYLAAYLVGALVNFWRR